MHSDVLSHLGTLICHGARTLCQGTFAYLVVMEARWGHISRFERPACKSLVSSWKRPFGLDLTRFHPISKILLRFGAFFVDFVNIWFVSLQFVPNLMQRDSFDAFCC